MGLRHEDQCVFCDTEFTVTTEDEDDEVVFCPFCGEELYEDEEDELDDIYGDDDWD
jgi:predicted  nucleic acid-binding Zn-ribbon protein